MLVIGLVGAQQLPERVPFQRQEPGLVDLGARCVGHAGDGVEVGDHAARIAEAGRTDGEPNRVPCRRDVDRVVVSNDGEGESPQHLAVGHAAIAGIGGLSALYMEHEGHWVTGMTNRVPWGLQIVMAVYYIGLSAGSLVISGLYGVFGKREYKPFARVTAYLAMLFLIAGLLDAVPMIGVGMAMYLMFAA